MTELEAIFRVHAKRRHAAEQTSGIAGDAPSAEIAPLQPRRGGSGSSGSARHLLIMQRQLGLPDVSVDHELAARAIRVRASSIM